MKVIQLEYFCAVSRCHSITQAAQKLYVTQPAISNAIRELEKEFSINLFTRSKNHLTLTKEGELFYQKASALLQYIEQTSSELYDLGRQTASVRIGIPPILSTIFFPDIFQEFKKRYPGISLELFEYGSNRAAGLVQEDVLDVSLVNMHFYDIDKMYSHRIMTEHIVFCVSPKHRLAGQKELTIEMLKEEPLIMYNTDSVQNFMLTELFEKIGCKPNVILHASQLYTIKKFVSNNLGGAFLYSGVLRKEPDIVKIPVVPLVEVDIGIVWKKGKYINGSAEKFISFMQKYGQAFRTQSV